MPGEVIHLRERKESTNGHERQAGMPTAHWASGIV